MSSAVRDLIAAGPQAVVQAAGRAVGLEIRKNGPSARDDLRLARFLADQRIALVLDIGANRGQFATGLFAAGYAGRIVSFEALPIAHVALTAAAARNDRWAVAPAGALSDAAGEVEFNVNSADATSSLLKASAESLDTIPGIRPQSLVRVATRRLDDVAADYGVGTVPTFLKIDVQGGEALVLAGAQATLEQVAGLVIELSFTQLYAGQPLAFDVLNPLLAMGFVVHDIAPAYRDPATFRLHQADVVLFHPDRLRS